MSRPHAAPVDATPDRGEDLLQKPSCAPGGTCEDHTAGITTCGPWLYTVARRVAIDAARARPAETTDTDVKRPAATRDDIERLLGTLHGMPGPDDTDPRPTARYSRDLLPQPLRPPRPPRHSPSPRHRQIPDVLTHYALALAANLAEAGQPARLR